MKKLKKKYEAFMAGKNAASLEDTLVKRLNQVEDLIASDEHTQEKVQMVLDHLDNTYQKVGLVKYDAFNEMGGKLSFSLAMVLLLTQCTAEKAAIHTSKKLLMAIP